MKTKNYYLFELAQFHLCVRWAKELKALGIKEYRDRLRMARQWWKCAARSKQTYTNLF